VADSVKQFDKGDSWRWIATVVDEMIQRSSSLDVVAWDGIGAGKLGSGVIDNILCYYEAKGDVQMLASIVCLLKSSFMVGGKTSRWTFLQDDCSRYNSYIKKYAELLYSWGQLTKCAEIKKFRFAEKESESPTNSMSDTINLSFKCPRCLSSSESGTNYCNSCHDYAMRCSICDLAVRGLFTVCERYVKLQNLFCCIVNGSPSPYKLWPRRSCKPLKGLVRRKHPVSIRVWLRM
jgi:hypothetical protein